MLPLPVCRQRVHESMKTLPRRHADRWYCSSASYLRSVAIAWDTGAVGLGRVTLNGDLSGDYVVEDQHPDGRVVLRPDLSVRAMLARHDLRELTPDEFERHFGALPTDGEG